MCGRFTQRYTRHEIHELYGLRSLEMSEHGKRNQAASLSRHARQEAASRFGDKAL
jgi:hypothetical protein